MNSENQPPLFEPDADLPPDPFPRSEFPDRTCHLYVASALTRLSQASDEDARLLEGELHAITQAISSLDDDGVGQEFAWAALQAEYGSLPSHHEGRLRHAVTRILRRARRWVAAHLGGGPRSSRHIGSIRGVPAQGDALPMHPTGQWSPPSGRRLRALRVLPWRALSASLYARRPTSPSACSESELGGGLTL